MYPELVSLYVDGQWTDGAGAALPVFNPATAEQIGTVAHAKSADLTRAMASAERGFASWRDSTPYDRGRILLRAATLLRERNESIALLMTQEQGKTLDEARQEVERGAQLCEWMAAEAQRIHGRSIGARARNVEQWTRRDPIGIVAAFTPWNFPINQMVRKLTAALAAGCAILVKGPEQTPASCAELVRALADAGIPVGAMNLLYGNPAEISEWLIPHPSVRKVSFTGSTAVGKQLAALAGRHMKPMTMELGGHAPVLVCADADIVAAAHILCTNKFRNAGQSCVSPTRFLIHSSVYERFIDAFLEVARKIQVGNGLDPTSTMGPLAHARRLQVMQELVADARTQGAQVRLGGTRLGERGYFFAPTVLTEVPLTARAMNEEPFGPIALMRSWDTLDEAIGEANRLAFGLASYVFTSSATTARRVVEHVQSGMVSINHFGLANPETPFGGMRDSGYGFEGGSEAIEAYLQTRFISAAEL